MPTTPPLAVLVLLLGLLGMHGLGGGHHAPATSPAATAAQHAAPVPAVLARHVVERASGDAGATAAPLPALPALERACPDCADRGVAVCLAVLSVAVTLLVRLRARRPCRRGAPATLSRLPSRRAGPPLRLRPPDLVAQLCVSRT